MKEYVRVESENGEIEIRAFDTKETVDQWLIDKNVDFQFSLTNWKITARDGLPEDDEWCFCLFGDKENLSWTVGGYNASAKAFWANMGLGGMVLQENDCIAWISWDDAKLNFIEHSNGKEE